MGRPAPSRRIARRPGRGGFNLVETLVVVVTLMGLVGVLFLSLTMSRTSYVSADTSVQLQQEARRALDNMVKELREAGRVNNGASIAAPGVQRLDFQIATGYDAVACGGVCWGTDDTAFPSGWLHYVLDTADPQNVRFMRCATANRLDPMPAGFAGCRVLTSRIDASLANTAFTYDHPALTVAIRLQAVITSQALGGGSMALSPTPLTTRIRLRNN
jgi:type II secretory pathway pseudopilin PulG